MQKKYFGFRVLLFLVGLFLLSSSVQSQCKADFTFNRNPISQTVSFTNTSTPNFLYNTWNFGDNSAVSHQKNPTHFYSTADTFLVCLVVRDSASTCFDTVCKWVYNTNQATCNANFYVSTPGPLDPPQTKRFFAYMVDTTKQYNWSFGDGSPLVNTMNAVHVYAGLGTYNVCLFVRSTAPDSCMNQYCKSVVVSITNSCATSISVVNDPNNPLKHYYVANNSDSSLSYKWTFYNGDTSVTKNTFKIYPKGGVYSVCLRVKKAKNGDTCVFNTCISDTLFNGCKADYSYSQPNWQNPKSLNFTYSGGSPNNTITWNFGHGSPLQTGNSLNHVFPAFGIYQVCLFTRNIFDSTCRDTVCRYINIRDTSACSAYFNMTFADSTNNKRVRFSPQIPFDSSTTYTWTFADSSTGSGYVFNKLFANYGYQKVCLRTVHVKGFDTCVAQQCDSVYVGCKADFIYARDNTLKNKVNFLGNYSFGVALQYMWVIDGQLLATQMNYLHTFNTGGNHNACLYVRSTIDSTCVSVKCKTVFIPCMPRFAFKQDSLNPQLIHFQNLVQGDSSTQVYWNFGDGQVSSLNNPSHTFSAPGYYKVCLNLNQPNFACSSTYCDSILIGAPNCKAAFVADLSNFPTVQFINLSSANSSLKYHWKFGDGTTSNQHSPLHTYPNDSMRVVQLLIQDSLNAGCRDSFTQIVEDSGKYFCMADFVYLQDAQYPGPGYRMRFYKAYPNHPGTIFLWTFGDGDTSLSQNPTHVYANDGNYTVCLSITNVADTCYKTHCELVAVIDSSSTALPEFLGKAEFSYYPNPFTDEIVLSFTGNPTHWNYNLYDVKGSLLLHGQHELGATDRKTTLSTGALPNGMYILELSNGFGSNRIKLIK